MHLHATAVRPVFDPGVPCHADWRTGATLIEVLVAIFVMGLGLLAILVLFPLGALNMAMAIRNDRCSQAALNASAIARFLPHNAATAIYSTADYGIRNDPSIIGPPNYYTAPLGPLPPASGGGPSYPVYIDPAGVVLSSGPPVVGPVPTGTPLGYSPPQLSSSGPVTGIPRLIPAYLWTEPTSGPAPRVPVSYLTARYFTLLDDLTFLPNGLPDASTNTIQRDGQYTWCYMTQIPTSVGSATSANLTIVVYDRRPLVLDATVSPAPPQGERSFMAKFDGNSNIVTLTWDPTQQDAPVIRRGGWILDATLVPNIHGFFYRVVGSSPPVTAGGNTMTMNLELQSNAQASVDQGVAVIMENVVEVFQRGQK